MITILVLILVAVLLCVTVPLFAFIALVVIGCVVTQAILLIDWIAIRLELWQTWLNGRAREIEEKGFWR
jgi:hypothetical protein